MVRKVAADATEETGEEAAITNTDPVVAPARNGYIHAGDFLNALREAIQTNNDELRDYLLKITDHVLISYLTVPHNTAAQYEKDLRDMRARSKATILLNTLTNCEDFSSEDVSRAYQDLRTVCHGDHQMVAQALADVR